MNTDMTKYCFQHFENAYNIGWKNNHKSSKQEDYGKEFIEKLKVFCQYPVNKDLNGKFRYLDAKEGGKCVTGFGEIRIIDIKTCAHCRMNSKIINQRLCTVMSCSYCNML